MPDPIDELLKQVEQGNSPRSSSKSASNAANSAAESAPAAPAAKSIDRLLAELEGKPVVSPLHDSAKSSQAANPQKPFDAQPFARLPECLLQQLDAALSLPKPIAAEQQQASQPPQPVFEQVRSLHRQELPIQQQQRNAIAQRAQAWLDSLDPHGGEALFFEKLAEKYPDRLEAAVDFLGLNSEQPQSE